MQIKTLLVDDEKALLDQAEIFLERIGERIEVFSTSSADNALEMMDEKDFDVIVSDYQMPGMDGLEFLEEVRKERDNDIPFIIFTGKGREEVAMKALNLGADRYIQKGGNPKSQYGVLVQAIEQEIQHYKTEKALKRSEERYESITEDVLEHADFGIIILDKNFDIVWINKPIEEYFGIDKEKVLGKDKETLVEEKVSPIFEDAEKFKNKVLATYQDNTYIEDFECHVLPDEEKDLKERWLRHWSKPIKRGLYHGGRIEHYTDITERKEIKKREKLFSSSLEEASLEVFWITPEGEFVFTNDTARGRLGYSKEELNGMHVWDIDPNYPKEKRSEFWKDLKERGRQEFISTHVKNDGKEYPVEITSQYIEHDGEEYEFAFAKDITERIEKKDTLHERVKELDCLYNVLTLTQSEDITVQNLMREVVDLIPKGFHHPKDTYARITIDDQIYESEEFVETTKSISESISTEDISGRLEVYVDKNDDEDVFLEKEEDMLNLISIHLENFIERKMKVEELEELNRFREAVIEDYNVWFNVTDEKGNILLWNKGAEKISGYNAEEVEGDDKAWELLYPDEEYRNFVMKKFSQIIDDKEIENIETKIERKDGEKRIISWSSRVWRDEEGNITGTIAIGRDVTEQKEFQRELRNEKNRFETLFEGNPEAIVELDEDFSVVKVNMRFERLFGFEEREIKGKNINELLAPEDRLSEAKNLDEKTVENGYFDHETVRLTKSGEEIDVAIMGRPIKLAEETHYLGVYRDITERKEVEQHIKKSKEKIEKLHEISAELETCKSMNDVYEHTVKVAERILEFEICAINAPEGDLMKAMAISSEFPDGASSVDKPLPIDDSLAGRTYREKKSFLVKDKSENEDVNPTFDEFRSGISVPIGDYAVFQAVSTSSGDFDEEDLRMTELLMDHVSEAVKRVEVKEREDFLHSLLRHDVGNKNQLIKGYLELAREQDPSDEVKNFIDKAEHVAGDSIEIIEKVRKLRKIERDEEIEQMNLSSVIDKAISEKSNQLQEKDIDIKREGCDCKIKGGQLLEELFSNLIENSIQHADCDKIKVSSRTEGDKCVVTVEDDGVGISEELKKKIFEKGFKEGENAGTGLGLYMVKEIAESYGGSVDVNESEIGGVRFIVRLEKNG